MNWLKDNVLLGKVKGSEALVWYPLTELLKHLVILGMTGSGKTNFLMWVLSQLIGRFSIWIFDKKQDFRGFVKIFPGKILVLDLMSEFVCNPLSVPPYVNPKMWLELITDLFCRSNGLWRAQETFY